MVEEVAKKGKEWSGSKKKIIQTRDGKYEFQIFNINQASGKKNGLAGN